jgi:hypothetical protein
MVPGSKYVRRSEKEEVEKQALRERVPTKPCQAGREGGSVMYDG